MCGVRGSQPLKKPSPFLPIPRHPLAHFVCLLVIEARQRCTFGGARQPSIREAIAPPRFSLAHPLRSGMLETSQLCFWGTKHSTPRGQLRPSSDTHPPASIQPFLIHPSTPLHHCSRKKSCELANTHIAIPSQGKAWMPLPSGNFFSFLKATS